MKMLGANSIVECCNPELQKLKGTWYLWEGSLENECPGGWLRDRMACPGALTFGLGVTRPGPQILQMLEVPFLRLDINHWSLACVQRMG